MESGSTPTIILFFLERERERGGSYSIQYVRRHIYFTYVFLLLTLYAALYRRSSGTYVTKYVA